MTQWVKVHAAMPGTPSCIPGTPVVEGEKQPLEFVLWCPRVWSDIDTPTTNKNVILKKV